MEEKRTPLRKAMEEVTSEVRGIFSEVRETAEDVRKTLAEIVPRPLRRAVKRRLQMFREERK